MEGFDKSLFTNKKVVAVALSGGEDSVCLLHLLYNKQQSLNISLVAVNVEHGIRKTSQSDTEFCQNLCKDLNIPLKVYHVDALKKAKQGLSIEEAARILRYDCFYNAIKEGFCDVIATAHHFDDDIETILFNIFRGTSVSGLKGMDKVSHNGRIIRPLLNVTKQQIKDYVCKNGLSYVLDETNADDNYTRNYLRLKIIPDIQKKFPGFSSALKRLSESAESDDLFLYELAKQSLVVKDGCVYVPINLPPPLFSRASVLGFRHLGLKKDFDNGHIEALFNLRLNQSGKKINLPNNLYAIKEHQNIVIKPCSYKEEIDSDFNLGKVISGGFKVNIEKVDYNKADFEKTKPLLKEGRYFDLDKIPKNSKIRYKKEGDIFYKIDGTKTTLKKFLTDKKIPADKKARTLVVANEGMVYIIIGLEVSSLCKVDSATINLGKITADKLL